MRLEIIIFLITLSPAKLVQLPGPEKKTAGIWERKLLNWNGLLYIIVIFSPYIPCNNCCLLPSSSTQLKMYVVIQFWEKQVPPKTVTVCVCVCVCTLTRAYAKSPTDFIVCVSWGIHKKPLNRIFNFSTQISDFLLCDSNLWLLIGSLSSKLFGFVVPGVIVKANPLIQS